MHRQWFAVSMLATLGLASTLSMSSASTIACDGTEETPGDTSGPKPCATKADCAIACDCVPPEGIDCTYEYACEDGFCHESERDGYSKAFCDDLCASRRCR
jgi:hypothetical protein